MTSMAAWPLRILHPLLCEKAGHHFLEVFTAVAGCMIASYPSGTVYRLVLLYLQNPYNCLVKNQMGFTFKYAPGAYEQMPLGLR
jgi:hypothetical protein